MWPGKNRLSAQAHEERPLIRILPFRGRKQDVVHGFGARHSLQGCRGHRVATLDLAPAPCCMNGVWCWRGPSGSH